MKLIIVVATVVGMAGHVIIYVAYVSPDLVLAGKHLRPECRGGVPIGSRMDYCCGLELSKCGPTCPSGGGCAAGAPSAPPVPSQGDMHPWPE